MLVLLLLLLLLKSGEQRVDMCLFLWLFVGFRRCRKPRDSKGAEEDTYCCGGDVSWILIAF